MKKLGIHQPELPPRNRMVLFVILVFVISAGLGSRWFSDFLPEFISQHAGDALWAVAVFLTLAILRPNATSRTLGILSLVASFAVEFSQLMDVDWLNSLRANRIARLFLGSGFLWQDLVRYTVGAFATTFADHVLRLWHSRMVDNKIASSE